MKAGTKVPNLIFPPNIFLSSKSDFEFRISDFPTKG